MKHAIALILLIIAPFLMGAKKESQQRPSLVVTAPVVMGVVNPLQTYIGTLYYDRQSELASEMEGVVKELSFKEGQVVKKGDAVATLDSEVLQSNIAAKSSAFEALEAELTRQERDLSRAKKLFEKKSISRSKYDRDYYLTVQLRARLKAAESEMRTLIIQLGKTRIKAPFDGTITKRNVEVGEWVGKGSTIGTLVATDTIEARLNIPARLIDILRATKEFQASVEGREITVSLKTAIPAADAQTRTFPVEMNVPKDLGFIEGMRVDVKVPTLKEQQSLMVPRDAVIKRFGRNVVFAAIDGKATMIPVTVIGFSNGRAAISGKGVAEKLRVVVKGNERIFPNMPIMEKGIKK